MIYREFSRFFRHKISSAIWRKSNGYCSTNTPARPPGKTILLDNVKIHYEQVGKGDEVVLLLPGALGSTRTDFDPQLRNLNHEKFTLVAWDPPGYGFSRPPDRNFSKGYLNNDAKLAATLMRKLNFHRYSVLGWSDGGATGMILTANNENAVKRFVILASGAYLSANDQKLYSPFKDIDNWSAKIKEPMTKLYGEQYFRKLCSDWIEGFNAIYRDGGNKCVDELAKIRCPTLIIYGLKDMLVSQEHSHHLQENIKGSRLEIFPEGNHHLHLQYPDEFNKLVETFLCQQ